MNDTILTVRQLTKLFPPDTYIGFKLGEKFMLIDPDEIVWDISKNLITLTPRKEIKMSGEKE